MTGTSQITSPSRYTPPHQIYDSSAGSRNKWINYGWRPWCPRSSLKILYLATADNKRRFCDILNKETDPQFSPKIEYVMQYRRMFINSVIIFKQYLTRNSLRIFFLWHNSPTRAKVAWLLKFLDPTYIHTHTHTIRQRHPVGLLWTSDQLVAEAATYTTHNKHKRRTTLP
jgi:hypothetical protein